VKVESLANIPLHAAWKVRIRFENGLVSFQVNEIRAIDVRTPFKTVAPYVSVSSGDAEFSIDL
jgi:hypothetical protein